MSQVLPSDKEKSDAATDNLFRKAFEVCKKRSDEGMKGKQVKFKKERQMFWVYENKAYVVISVSTFAFIGSSFHCERIYSSSGVVWCGPRKGNISTPMNDWILRWPLFPSQRINRTIRIV